MILPCHDVDDDDDDDDDYQDDYDDNAQVWEKSAFNAQHRTKWREEEYFWLPSYIHRAQKTRPRRPGA